MKKLLIICAAMLVLAGCSKETTTSTSGDNSADNAKTSETVTEVKKETPKEGFEFVYNNVTIPMNVDVTQVLEKLGDSNDYFEAPSCAFQGLDKIYYYPGFELSTYPSEDKDFISSVNFLDDSVTTDKGIYLGSSLEEVLAAYGDDYTETNGSYIYTKGDTKLTFIIEDGFVAGITYAALVEGLNN